MENLKKTILVTGASGNLGKATLNYLATQVDSTSLYALVRDVDKAKDIAEKGIDLRIGDYDNHDSLVSAFTGVERVFLVGTVAFVDRFAQHKNVIDAAKQAGVKYLVFSSIQRKEGVDFDIPGNTQSDILTEQYLVNSGLSYTILKNTLYADTFPLFLGSGFMQVGAKIALAKEAQKIPFATRLDLAEAAANVLINPSSHLNKTYTLTGSELLSFFEVTEMASKVKGSQVTYTQISKEEYIAQFVANGLPDFFGEYLYRWVQAFEAGALDELTTDLENLLNRKPTTVNEYLATLINIKN